MKKNFKVINLLTLKNSDDKITLLILSFMCVLGGGKSWLIGF